MEQGNNAKTVLKEIAKVGTIYVLIHPVPTPICVTGSYFRTHRVGSSGTICGCFVPSKSC